MVRTSPPRRKTALLFGALAALATIIAPAAGAAPTPEVDWWLVYGRDDQGRAQLVDLATLHERGDERRIIVLSVDALGRARRLQLRIDCAQVRATQGSLPAFLCGDTGYRQGAGLNIRDFPPIPLAQIYLRELASAP